MSAESPLRPAAVGCPDRPRPLPSGRLGELGDGLTEDLIGIRLQLEGVLPTVDGLGDERLRSAIDRLDSLIAAAHNAGLAMPEGPAQDGPAPGGGGLPGRLRGTRRGHGASDIHRLIQDARRLRGQLHRVTVALALTEEFAADALERMADDGGPHAESRRLWAQQARDGAQACRELDARLDDPLPRGVVCG